MEAASDTSDGHMNPSIAANSVDDPTGLTDQECLSGDIGSEQNVLIAAPKRCEVMVTITTMQECPSLGMDVDYGSKLSLSVVRVWDQGLTREWNNAHRGLDLEVQLGDHIIAANGKAETSLDIS